MSKSQIFIGRQCMQQMQDHIEKCLPDEACGLLAGNNDTVSLVLPVKNILQSQVRYRMDPQEQLTHFLYLENHNLELLGIYHSHPMGPAFPSETDLAEAYYPETAYIIWSPKNSVWICRAFQLKNGAVTPIKLTVC